jgi:hypothetical protein
MRASAVRQYHYVPRKKPSVYIVKANKRKKKLVQRFAIVFALCIILNLLILVSIYSVFPKYDIKYVDYQMKSGETMYEVIQKLNKDYEGTYDVRDLIIYVKEENDLESAGKIQIGEIYKIPVIKKKYSIFEYYLGGK